MGFCLGAPSTAARASTGPRPRGSGWPAAGPLRRPRLRSFNGAAAPWSRMVEFERELGDQGAASTGPRPRGRGWLGGGTEAAKLLQASTGPRPRGRGWAAQVAAHMEERMLQRGRDHVVADGSTARREFGP